MKSNPKSLAFFILLLLLTLSCTDDSGNDLTPDDFWDCHNSKKWDVDKIEANLLGNWKLNYTCCVCAVDASIDTTISNLELSFNEDNTLDVIEENEIIKTHSWKINDHPFELEVEPFLSELLGLILFCDEQVVFKDSDRDGCNNYFSRK